MFDCPTVSYNTLGGFGLGSFGDNAPVGKAANAYYRAGTPFLWLAPKADFGFAWSTDPGRDARNGLAASLAAKGYSVRVLFGERGGPLEVSGSQGIDRSRATHIRDQITGEAQRVGFLLGSTPIQFNVEAPNVPFRVGQPGSVTVWGDQAPVAAKSIFEELGVDLSGDPSFLGGSIKNLAIYVGLGLLAFVLITKAIK